MFMLIFEVTDDSTLDRCIIFANTADDATRDEGYEIARQELRTDVSLVGVAELDWQMDGSDSLYLEHAYIG